MSFSLRGIVVGVGSGRDGHRRGREEVVHDGVERVEAGGTGARRRASGRPRGRRRRRRCDPGRSAAAPPTRRGRRTSRGASPGPRRRGCPATSSAGRASVGIDRLVGAGPARVGRHDPAGDGASGARWAVRLAAAVPLDDRRLEGAGPRVPGGGGLGETQEQRGAEREVRGRRRRRRRARGASPGRAAGRRPSRWRRGRTSGCRRRARGRHWRRATRPSDASTTTSAVGAAGREPSTAGRPIAATVQPRSTAAAAIAPPRRPGP